MIIEFEKRLKIQVERWDLVLGGVVIASDDG